MHSNIVSLNKHSVRNSFKTAEANRENVSGNYKKDDSRQYLYQMTVRITLLILTGLLFSSCLVTDTKSCEFVASYSISKGLYIEKYKTFNAGVFGEVTTCYLTDSVSFRQKVGSYDEHESFYAKKDSDKIVTYNFQWSRIPIILETKVFSKSEIMSYHHDGKGVLTTTPLFGENTIKCDTNFYPASSWRTDEGSWWSQLQFKCGPSDFQNAVFYTDSLKYSIFVGVCEAGQSDRFRVNVKKVDTFEFQHIDWKDRRDAVKSKTFNLPDLVKKKFVEACD